MFCNLPKNSSKSPFHWIWFTKSNTAIFIIIVAHRASLQFYPDSSKSRILAQIFASLGGSRFHRLCKAMRITLKMFGQIRGIFGSIVILRGTRVFVTHLWYPESIMSRLFFFEKAILCPSAKVSGVSFFKYSPVKTNKNHLPPNLWQLQKGNFSAKPLSKK